MVGNIVAWILGLLSAGILIAAERRRGRRRESYHRELIREFSGEGPEKEAVSDGSDGSGAGDAGEKETGKKYVERG